MTDQTHQPQCVTIGGGPGHDRCICYCHTTLGTSVTVTKDQIIGALMANDDADLTGFRWSDAVFDDLLTATGHDYASAQPAPLDEERLAAVVDLHWMDWNAEAQTAVCSCGGWQFDAERHIVRGEHFAPFSRHVANAIARAYREDSDD